MSRVNVMPMTGASGGSCQPSWPASGSLCAVCRTRCDASLCFHRRPRSIGGHGFALNPPREPDLSNSRPTGKRRELLARIVSQVSSLGIRAFQVTPKRAAKTSFSTQIVLKSQKTPQFTPYTDSYKSLYRLNKILREMFKISDFRFWGLFQHNHSQRECWFAFRRHPTS